MAQQSWFSRRRAQRQADEEREEAIYSALPSYQGLARRPLKGVIGSPGRHTECPEPMACLDVATKLKWYAMDCGSCPVKLSGICIDKAEQLRELAVSRPTAVLSVEDAPGAIGVNAHKLRLPPEIPRMLSDPRATHRPRGRTALGTME